MTFSRSRNWREILKSIKSFWSFWKKCWLQGRNQKAIPDSKMRLLKLWICKNSILKYKVRNGKPPETKSGKLLKKPCGILRFRPTKRRKKRMLINNCWVHFQILRARSQENMSCNCPSQQRKSLKTPEKKYRRLKKNKTKVLRWAKTSKKSKVGTSKMKAIKRNRYKIIWPRIKTRGLPWLKIKLNFVLREVKIRSTKNLLETKGR